MKRLILIVPLALMLASCANMSEFDEECPEHTGYKSITLYYDEDGISIKAKKEVKKKSVFAIKLQPSPDFRDKEVKTVGISVEPNDANAPGKGWLNKTGKRSISNRIVYCVPDLDPAVPAENSYVFKYSVEVEDLGILDPRIEVTH